MPRVTRKKSEVKQEVKDEPLDVDSDKEDAKCERTSPSLKSTPQSQCLMIAPDDFVGDSNVKIVKLRHPRTSTGSLFAFSCKDTQLFEINVFDDGKRSWFVDDSVISDGSLLLTTKVDPLFFVIPYLRKGSYASPLDQVIDDEEFKDALRLCSCAKEDDLKKIADLKESGSFQAWKFNETKTLSWLENKIAKLSGHLKQKNHNVNNSAIASNYIKATKTDIPDDVYKRYAFGLVSEYLSEDFAAVLEKHLGLPPVDDKRSEEIKEPPLKRQKLNDNVSEPTEDYTKDASPPIKQEKVQTTAKAKALANAAKGSKSIASFFGKK